MVHTSLSGGTEVPRRLKPAPHLRQTEAIGRIPWWPHNPKRQRGDGLASKNPSPLTLGAMWKTSRRAVKTLLSLNSARLSIRKWDESPGGGCARPPPGAVWTYALRLRRAGAARAWDRQASIIALEVPHAVYGLCHVA